MSTAQLPLDEAAEKARQALATSPVFALRELRVERHGDNLLLQGKVGSFYHKQLAQEAVRAVAAEARLVNSIDVAQPPAISWPR